MLFRELSKIETLKDFYGKFLRGPEVRKKTEHAETLSKIISVMVWYIEDFFHFNPGNICFLELFFIFLENKALHRDFHSDRIHCFRKICETTLTAFYHDINIPIEPLYVPFPEVSVLPKVMTPFVLEFWKNSSLQDIQTNMSECLRPWDEHTISSLVM